jgi:MSHA biogenesis protein MshO
MAGFTLIEGVIVITLISVLAAVAGLFIVQPFSAAQDMTRRAELTDAAETALDRMTREIRLAVPNSVRETGNAVEFLRSKTGGRYRRLRRDSDGSGDVLDPTQASKTFDVLGGLAGSIEINPRSSGGRNCADGNGDCLVINNTGTTGFNAYPEPPGGTRDTVAAITESPGKGVSSGKLAYDTGGSTPGFPAHSPRQRFQVLDTVVSYVCDTAADTEEINRYQGYGLEADQPVPPDVTPDLLAGDVTRCEFDYESSASQRHGLVTIDITIQRKGETVRLIDQAHVVNVP